MSSFRQGPPTALSAPPNRKLARRPCLLVLSGADMGRTIELGNEPVEIGRSDDCTVTVNSDVVSRKHARVQLIFGLYFVTDLESANGTFVGEQRVAMAELKDGDQIRVGDCVLKFVENHIEVEYARRAMNLVNVDALTQTGNKRHFDDIFARELARAVQFRTALSLLLLDVDHFKRINDEWGHLVGDRALATVAAAAQSVLAPDQLLCRVGGEEFAILLPDLARSAALTTAERLRATVAATSVEEAGRRVPLTVSIGAAEFDGSESHEAFYQRADQQLYSAKNGGRNRVS